MKSSYDKRLAVLEIVALRGLVSSYELSKILGVGVSHAQWWLRNHWEIREVKREKVQRQRVLYGLTMIGFLLALKRPKVRRNFATAYERFLSYQDEGADRKLKQNLLEALRSSDVCEKFKQFYLAISDALDDLTDVYSMDDDTVIQLATHLAGIKEPDKMRLIFKDLYPKVLLVQRMVDAYRQYASSLDKILEGEM